jgi:hypothetical protein
MYRINACLAVLSMLFALVSAPLFHIHPGDHHGQAVVHAHFLESEIGSSTSEHTIETPDTHAQVRSLDVFTLNTPATVVFHAIAEFSEPLAFPAEQSSRRIVSMDAFRAHSPPEATGLPTRSPPIL